MNLLEHKIIKILGEPEHHTPGDGQDYYTVRIQYDCCGVIDTEDHFCFDKEIAENLKVGDIYLA